MQYYGTGRLGTHQSKAYTAAAGTIDNAITTGTQKVRVVVTTAAYVRIEKDAIATTADAYMGADVPEYFTISAGEKVSAIRVASDGTLHVTEIS